MVQLKTSGRISAKLLGTIFSRNKGVFTLKEAEEILGSNRTATRKVVNNMVARNLITMIKPGKYLLIPQGITGHYLGDLALMAREISNSPDSYISHYSALDLHDMLTQPLTRVYVSSPKRQIPPRPLKKTLTFIYVKKPNVWGVEELWVTDNEKVRVSDLERTILDCLWQPQYAGGITEIAKGLWLKQSKIDYSKLLKYALKYNKYVVTKRLGFILETLGLGEGILPDLKQRLNRRYDLLDPSLPAKATFKNSWYLAANIDPLEIKGLIKT